MDKPLVIVDNSHSDYSVLTSTSYAVMFYLSHDSNHKFHGYTSKANMPSVTCTPKVNKADVELMATVNCTMNEIKVIENK